jgi:hypothetical protein
MKLKVFILLVVLAPALFLITSCRSETRPAGTETPAATEASSPEAVKPEISEPEAGIRGKGPIGFRSGIIEYTYSGDKTGKSTQYFDDYGIKSAVYAEILTQGEQSKGWALTIGEDQYMWDLARPGTGMKAKNPMVKMMMDKTGAEIEAYTASMYEQMGMKKSGTEMFQGKECTLYKGDIGKVLIWNGILMMMEMNMGSVVSRQEATSVQTNVSVDGKYFRVPSDITFSEIPGF